MQNLNNTINSKLENYIIRAATLNDIDDAVNLENKYWVEMSGKPGSDAGELLHLWKSPIMKLERDSCTVFTKDNIMVGLAYVEDRDPFVKLESSVFVHPEFMGKGIGAYFICWLEARAELSIPKAPDNTRIVLDQYKPVTDITGRNFLERNGYQAVRYFSRMEREIKSLPPEPDFPEGLSVVSGDNMAMRKNEFNRVYAQAQIEIFRDHWGFVEQSVDALVEELEHWEKHKPNFDPSLVFAAMAGNEMVAQLVCTPSIPEDTEMAYIEVVGVVKEWRQKGIALALLHYVFRELFQREIYKVSLDVDSESLTGATRLYEKAGMHSAWQEINFEKEIRPGKDLATQ
ncbi:MAG: GNAT family N-acetyltransferase [Desulfobacterales bacterium]|nr:GNAT family N-acetyltransferase [Desulfobacterales bacterium]